MLTKRNEICLNVIVNIIIISSELEYFMITNESSNIKLLTKMQIEANQ